MDDHCRALFQPSGTPGSLAEASFVHLLNQVCGSVICHGAPVSVKSQAPTCTAGRRSRWCCVHAPWLYRCQDFQFYDATGVWWNAAMLASFSYRTCRTIRKTTLWYHVSWIWIPDIIQVVTHDTINIIISQHKQNLWIYYFLTYEFE
jgi:hypothetical protein